MKLNLGCGTKQISGYLNIDNEPTTKPDMVLDLTKTPYPWKNNSIEKIRLDNTIEHLHVNPLRLILELKRILKPNGKLFIIAPNCFYWKSRLKFLFGRFEANQGYHFEHCWFLKPSFLKKLLDYYGFETSQVNDLFDQEIRITARKRA